MTTSWENLLRLFMPQKTPRERELEWMKKTQDFCEKARYIPGLQGLFVCNSLSFYATKPTSDIDLFVICSPNTIWFVRGALLLLALVTNTRARGKNTKGRFCFSFFITTNHLSLLPLAQKTEAYLWYWIAFLKPIINFNTTYEQFLLANNFILNEDLLEQVQMRVDKKISAPAFYINKSENTRFMCYTQEKCHIPSFFLALFNFISKILSYPAFYFHKLTNQPHILLQEDIIKLHNPDKRHDINQELFHLY